MPLTEEQKRMIQELQAKAWTEIAGLLSMVEFYTAEAPKGSLLAINLDILLKATKKHKRIIDQEIDNMPE